MTQTIKHQNENQVFVLIPQAEFEEFKQAQNQILKQLGGKDDNRPGIGDFISKEEAQRVLGRKSTTLWKLRQAGKIKSAKIGSEVFYSRSSIVDFLTKNLK